MAVLADGGKALHTKAILFRVEFPNGSHQRVGKVNPLLAALDGKADVVGQRDEQAFVQRVFQPLPDGFYQLIGKQQMLIGDLFQKFHQLLLHGRAGHAVAVLHGFGLDFIARLSAKAQPAPGDNQLTARGVHHAQDVVVDRFFDGILHCFSSSGWKRQ